MTMQGYNNTAAIDQNRPNTTSRARRNVAHLDAGQLERKRAVDRDAQRAFRQRTRFQIEQLEQQIAQLKSQGTSTVSKSVIEERNTLRCENERLKARIVSIESALQTVLNLCHHEKPNERLRHEAFTNSEEPCLQRESPISKGILNAESMQQCIIRQPTPRTCASLQSIVPDNPSLMHGIAYSTAFVHQHQQGERTAEASSTGGQLCQPEDPLEDLFPNIDSWISSMNVFGIAPEDATPWVCPPMSPHQAFPLNCVATCSVDIMWSEFITSRSSFKSGSELHTDGKEQAANPNYPTLSHLLNPSTAAAHPVGQLLTSILDAYCRPSALPEQVACLFKMYRLIRWQIAPTMENYDSLPSWLAPTASQLLTPHPAWIDQIVWPRARNFLIKHQSSYNFHDYSDTFSGALRINWPYDPADVLLVQIGQLREGMDKNAEQVVVNPIFEQHVLDLRNWTITSKVAEVYPELAECCQV